MAGEEFRPERGFGRRGVFAGGGFWPEGDFGRWGVLAGKAFWPERSIGRRGVLVVGLGLSGGDFCSVPIHNNGGYTKY